MGDPTGSTGLKGQWGVGNPASPTSPSTPTTTDTGSDKQAQDFQAAFQQQQGVINGHLQYTSANAEAACHDPLAARRDALYAAFQSALGKIDRNNPAKAQGDIDKVLGDASALAGEVGTFRQQAEKAKNDWDSRQGSYDETVHKVEELEAWEDAKAPALRGLVDGIRNYVNQRQYAQATTTLDQLLPKLAPIYEEYLRQKEAKPQYEQQLAEQTARLDPLKAADRPSQPMTAKAGEADSAMQQAKGKADSKDFVAGLEQMHTVQAAIDELDQMANDPERAKFLADIGGVEQIVQPPAGTAFHSQEADWSAITALKDQVAPAGDGGDYAGANGMLADLKDKVDAFKAKHDELEQQKQAYEDALTQAQPRLQAVSVSEPQYAKLQPMQQALDAARTQMEAAAQAEDYAQALTLVQDLSSQLDALEQAKAEIDQKKLDYETALAAVQPRLQAASSSEQRYAKLEPMLQELAQAQTSMEASAQAGDYEQANTQLDDVREKLDACEDARKELDEARQAYEQGLAEVQPRLDKALQPAQTKALNTARDAVATAKTDVDTAAKADDYDAAVKGLDTLRGKLDEFDKAVEALDAKKKDYETLLSTLQPRLAKAAQVKNDKLKKDQDHLAADQKSMEASALVGDWEEALTTAQDLSKQLDTFEKAAADDGSMQSSLGGEVSIGEISLKKVTFTYLKAEAKVGAAIKFGLAGDPPAGSNVKKEDVEKSVLQKAQEVFNAGKWEMGEAVKVNPKERSVTLAVAPTFTCEWGPVKGEFAPVEVSLIGWDKKSGLSGPKATVVSLTLSYKNESMRVTVGDVTIEFAAAGSFGVEISPDYAAIAEWVLKNVAESLLETMVEGIVLDTAALAAAAGAVALPAAAAVAIGFGMYQESRNMAADQAAIATALPARKKAEQVASSYASVLCGGKSGGSDEGAQSANAQLAQIMDKTGATREQVQEAIRKAQGGYEAVRGKEIQRIKELMYAEACSNFDEGHKSEFGFLENRGPDWGFRGSFRKTLRIVLFGGD